MHSELELVIMHGQCIEVYLPQERLIIKPYDMVTRKDSGEFLLARDENDNNVEIRLDKIKRYRII